MTELMVWFITADGEAGKPWGNETIRVHPDEGWLELKLPAPLAHLGNRPHDRGYVFSHGELSASGTARAQRGQRAARREYLGSEAS
jgi:hypothetical protein